MTHVSVRRGLLYVSVAATAWGTGGAAAALIYRLGGLGPVAVSFWRFAIGAVLLAVAGVLLARTGVPAGRGRMAITGVCMAVSQTSYFAAVGESGLAVATVVTLGAAPVLVAAGARFVLGERLGAARLGSVAAAPAGLVLLSLPGGSAEFSPRGLGWALLSAVTYASVTLVNRAGSADPYGTALGSLVVGGIFLLPAALAAGVLPSGGHPVAAAALLAYLGAVPTALAYGLFFAGLRAVPATTSSVIVLVEPLGATLIGVFLLGETLTPYSAAGAAVLLLAVLTLALREPH
ncbi:DMT family transporter [Spongiactinospora sp. 9N601]|uniref:DMT family transporter n=1 Tax=Spongiactinospora sp. 9N601 TaxID=3375149 RepID=UPI003793DD5C